MTDRQLAVLWWRQLFSELGASEQTGAIGPLGQWARERTSALRTLNFALLMQLPIDCLIEVGAHNAETSKAFVAKKPKGRAVAYEAVPEIYERVVAAGLPEALTMHNVAVGAEAGVAKFRVPVEDRLKIWASSRKRVGNHEVREVLVPMITLDEAGSDVVQIRPGRDLALWIDVEGCALDVLRGGPNLLERRVGIVFVEVNDVSAYEGGATALDIISLFLKNGFIPVARDNQYGDAWNLLAVHEDCYFEARETIARWFYKNSGVTVATNWLAGKLAPANGV
jgi:FkbM family methyltransferase